MMTQKIAQSWLGWQVRPSKFFDQRNWHAPPATYASDFGDDWQHVVVHDGIGPSPSTAAASPRI